MLSECEYLADVVWKNRQRRVLCKRYVDDLIMVGAGLCKSYPVGEDSCLSGFQDYGSAIHYRGVLFEISPLSRFIFRWIIYPLDHRR